MTTNIGGLALTNINKQRVTLFVNPSILKQARAQAVVEDLSLTAFVEKSLINVLPKETIIRKTVISKPPTRNNKRSS
ncbi:MAG TPA: hypothetical protein VI819_05375 [Patescibacteria group bacterium]|nr:hypothetical protein [Patescibacteria group bacterium]